LLLFSFLKELSAQLFCLCSGNAPFGTSSAAVAPHFIDGDCLSNRDGSPFAALHAYSAAGAHLGAKDRLYNFSEKIVRLLFWGDNKNMPIGKNRAFAIFCFKDRGAEIF
jgi:hypothetical protein